MPLLKPKAELKTAILIPCYKRPEYTEKCLMAMFEAQEYENTNFYVFDDGSLDGTDKVIMSHKYRPGVKIFTSQDNCGLRETIIGFFDMVRGKYDLLAKMDNDCLVPKNWLNDIIEIFRNSPVDILSPDVFPSNAALNYGSEDHCGYGYRPTKIIGGLWAMKSELIDNMYFENHKNIRGLKGAIPIIRQIVNEKDPIMGWASSVVVQDLGHWSGNHPDHIKTKDHEMYSLEVGREIMWNTV